MPRGRLRHVPAARPTRLTVEREQAWRSTSTVGRRFEAFPSSLREGVKGRHACIDCPHTGICASEVMTDDLQDFR